MSRTLGLLGSISTVFLTLLELHHAGSLSGMPDGLLSGMLVISVLAFVRYSWLKIDGTIRDLFGLRGLGAAPQLPPQTSGGVKAAEEAIAPVAPLPPPMPRLTLL